MKGILKNHWYITNNELGISLTKFYVGIEILKNDNYVFYHLEVTDEKRNKAAFNFYTLEDAIYFTEDIIDKCDDNNDLLEKYNNIVFKNPVYDNIKIINNHLTLNIDEIKKAITNCYSYGKDYNITVEMESSQNDLTFYIIEHFNYEGLKQDRKTRLTEGDLLHVFNFMLKGYNYETVDFQYITSINSNKEIHPEGIDLIVTKKANFKQKVRV